ncbi:MAG: glycosyltransferase family 2 protein, partial [Alphaproteobacteria bacterium]|nr:glycosyltransferase family 2 protein [Alphaproteobacteria bacterium]
MPEPVVAIITRTKDRPILLRRAIDSVLAQHYSDWVHVIVNDGGDPAPVDGLLAGYMDAYAGRLVRVDNPQSLGMEVASNRGIAASASRYLIIHD